MIARANIPPAPPGRRLRRGLGALAVGAVLLAGCVVREDESAVRIEFSIWGTPAQEEVERQIVRAFERSQLRIRVDVLPVGSARYQEKLQAMMVGGIAPDVMLVNHQEYDDWRARGQLADLTALQRQIRARLTLMPGPRRLFERDGRFFALPVNGHGFVTFVNLDAFAAAGIAVPPEGFTWKQIEAFGPRLSRKAGNPRALTDYALVMPGYTWPLLAELGGAFFDDPYHPTRPAIDSPEGAAWIAWLRRLDDSGWCAPNALIPPDLVTYDLFRDRRVALYFIGRWQVPDLVGATDFRWDVRPFPAGPRGRITWHGGTAIAVSAHARHPEAARAFARFYADRAGAEIAVRGGRYVPVYAEIAERPAFLDLRPPDSPQVFVDTMQEGAASAWLYAPGVQEVWDLVRNRTEQALANRRLSDRDVVRLIAADLARWLEHERRQGLLPEARAAAVPAAPPPP